MVICTVSNTIWYTWREGKYMTEFNTYQPNPLERLNIAEYSVPTLDQLTDEQLQKLEAAGIQWVETPVAVDTFEEAEDFQMGSNNFFLRFSSGGLGAVYRGMEHYRRFEIVHPEISEYLQREIGAKSINDLTDTDWLNLQKTYIIMGKYLDANDQYVTTNGIPDTYYLCR